MQFSESEIRESQVTLEILIIKHEGNSRLIKDLNTAIETIEKALPKEAKTDTYGGKQFLICECGHNARLTAKYCDECGQRIREGA